MTGRERIHNIIEGRGIDRVGLTTLIDGSTRIGYPEEYRNLSAIEFYRKIGYDVFCFGSFGHENGPIYPYSMSFAHETAVTENEGSVVVERKIGGRGIRQIYKADRITKFSVETAGDLKVLIDIYEAADCVATTGEELAKSKKSLVDFNAHLGEDGIYNATVNPSAVQMLIEFECGVENFYYLLSDERELMERAIEAIQNLRRKEYTAIAENMDILMAIPVENTSTRLTSPGVYRKYSLPHIREYTEIAHKNGKKSVIHMCGHLRGLLGEFKEAGIDGIHALTPPAVGDCPLEEALDILGEDIFAVNMIGSEFIHDPKATPETIGEHVKCSLTPRVKRARFLHAVQCDGIPTPMWKFEAVREAVEKYGKTLG